MKKFNIFIACDTTKISKINRIINATKKSDFNLGYKFGLEFINSVNGRKYISKLKKKIVFLDLKLNDIPIDEKNYSFDYNYAISLWTYIYGTSPSLNHNYNKYTLICDYGGKPSIFYKADENILMITAKLEDLTEERIQKNNLDLDDDGNVIIYKEKHMLLQKWNNIVRELDKIKDKNFKNTDGDINNFFNCENLKTVTDNR